MSLLQLKHICKSFSGVYANENINLSVEKGEIHALLGENGAGKTTLVNIIFGLYTACRFCFPKRSNRSGCRNGSAALFSCK